LFKDIPARSFDLMKAAITLQRGQRELLAQALSDAIYYRDPPVYCPSCDAAERALCDGCVATLARASAYLDLRRKLGLEAPA
jgi:hypothetical protein